MNKLYAVGLGPGGEEFFTGQARAAIEKSDIVCGYTVYVDLVKEVYPDKEYFTTAMRQEIDRCRKALELAESGKTVVRPGCCQNVSEMLQSDRNIVLYTR